VAISFKSVRACEQDRPEPARSRRWWQRLQPSLSPKRLVFIDETWTKTNMTRGHGWWMTFIAALRHDSITAPCVLDGHVNGERFAAYVEEILVPT
jgi:hypothetical protein